MGTRPNVIPFGMTDAALAKRIAEVASDSSGVILTPHAKRRMRERKIILTQVLQVLQRGVVAEPAHRNIYGNWQCVLERLVAGDRIRVVAALEERGIGVFVVVLTVIN